MRRKHVKRLSRSLITALLVALIAFAFIGCQTAEEAVEVIPAPAAPEAPPAEEAVAEAPVVEEVPAAEVVAEVEEAPAPAPAAEPARKAPTADMVVKSNDKYDEFNLYIAHTNDVLGALDEGIGYAKLATGIQYGSSLTNKTMLLDAGNVAAGSPAVEQFYGEPAGVMLDALGYDAVAPGPVDFTYGADYLKAAAKFASENTNLKVLSANVLNAKGEWIFQPYQLYYYNDFVVAVIGATAPPADTEGLSFLDQAVIDNAQYAVDVVREQADFVILLGNIGDAYGVANASEVIAKNVKGIDLIIDGADAMAPANGKKVGSTTIVNAGERLSSVGLVEIHVKNDTATRISPVRITAQDVNSPKTSALAKAVGVTYVPAHPEVQKYIDQVNASYMAGQKKAPVMEKPVEKKEVAAPAKEAPAKPAAPAEPARKAPTADMVVKSNDKYDEFNLYIAHTNDVLGVLDQGVGYAKLATGIQFGSSLTNKTMLLDAGNAVSGTPEVEAFYGEPIGALMAALGYDAVAPGPADFAYGADYLKAAAKFASENTNLKVLSANVLNAKGEWIFQPYQLYYYNGFVVAVIGATAPPADTEGLSFLDQAVIDNAQYAVDVVREQADFVILLGNIGDAYGVANASEVIAKNVKGIDLIIDGADAMAPANGKKVGSTTIVNAGEKLSSVGLVEIHVKNAEATRISPVRITAQDVNSPKTSALASAVGITYVPAQPQVKEFVGMVKAAYEAGKKEAPVVKAMVETKVETKAAPKAAPEAVPAPAKPDVPADVIVKSAGDSKNFDLFIVHTNDVHGRIEPSDDTVGYSRLATLVNLGKSVTDKALVLDAGDVLHGTLLTNMFEGETSAVLLDLVGYDAVAPGNHDFNYGQDRLIQGAKLAEQYTDIKVLSANVLNAKGEWVFQPYQLYYFDGFTIAVIGLTTPDTQTKTHPKNVEGLSFMSQAVIDNAQYAIDLAHQRADYVIVLGHIGNDGDSVITSKEIVENVKGIDLFVDGHSHSVLENGMRVGDTLIVSAGEYMDYVGLVDVQVRNGKAVGETAYLISGAQVNDPSTSELAKMVGITEVKEDATVKAYVDSQKAKVEKITSEVVAYTPVDLVGERAMVRTRPTNMGNMIADAMIEATGADVALTNGGGIRASIAAGDVTRGDVITVLPFNNVTIVVEVTGQDIYDALEWGYSKLPETNGGFPQTAGMRVVYSRFSDPGNRIKRVLIDGKSIDKDATYTLATNDFLAAGGDGYTMLDKPVVMYGRGLDEVFTDYLVKHFGK